MKIVCYTRGSVRGTRLIYIISHQERFLWKNTRYEIAAMALYLPYGIFRAIERQREVQQHTELALLQYADHFAGSKRLRKTKLRTNVK